MEYFDSKTATSTSDFKKRPKAKWLKLEEGASVRGVILFNKFPLQLVYGLDNQNAKAQGKRGFVGTFKSLSAKNGLSRSQIKELIDNGDPEGKLAVDAKVLGKAPDVNGAVPMLVYPVTDDGDLDTELLELGRFQLKILPISYSRLIQLQKIAEALREDEDGRDLNSVDVVIKNEGAGQGYKFTYKTDSYYNEHKAKFKDDIKSKLRKEYERLEVKNLEEFSSAYVGMSHLDTDAKWLEKFTELGYDLSNVRPTEGMDKSFGEESKEPEAPAKKDADDDDFDDF